MVDGDVRKSRRRARIAAERSRELARRCVRRGGVPDSSEVASDTRRGHAAEGGRPRPKIKMSNRAWNSRQGSRVPRSAPCPEMVRTSASGVGVAERPYNPDPGVEVNRSLVPPTVLLAGCCVRPSSAWDQTTMVPGPQVPSGVVLIVDRKTAIPVTCSATVIPLGLRAGVDPRSGRQRGLRLDSVEHSLVVALRGGPARGGHGAHDLVADVEMGLCHGAGHDSSPTSSPELPRGQGRTLETAGADSREGSGLLSGEQSAALEGAHRSCRQSSAGLR
jgi:hypothetical protein